MLEQYNDALWFFAGVFSYRILSGLLTYGHMANLVRSINEQILKMLKYSVEEIAFVRGIKYVTMSEAGMDDDQINKIKVVDDKSFYIWRSACIANMLTNCPRIYRHTMSYSDWGGAIKELEKIYRREIEEGKGYKIEK
tara:strand:+ start:1526 stop:1939 length:414 start_codon:yes stop_codon:yes gene_type:complete